MSIMYLDHAGAAAVNPNPPSLVGAKGGVLTSTTVLSLTDVTGTVSGDEIFIGFYLRDITIDTVPSGFTLVEDWDVAQTSISTPSDGTDTKEFKLYHKTSAGSEPSSYAFDITDNGSNYGGMFLSVWRDVATIAYGTPSANDSITGPTVVDGDMMLAMIGIIGDTTSTHTDVPTGYTNATASLNTVGDTGYRLVYKSVTSSGPEGTIDFGVGARWDDWNLAMYIHLT